MNDSCFIVFEGLDGTGKTLLSEKLTERLKKELPDATIKKYRTPAFIREIVLPKNGINWDPISTALLMLGDMSFLWQKYIREDLMEKNTIVICDRWKYSTYAYNLAMLDIDNRYNYFNSQFYYNLFKMVENFPSPNITFIVEARDEIIQRRLMNKDKDRMEIVSSETFLKRKEAYDNMYSTFSREEFMYIDNNENEELEYLMDKIVEFLFSEVIDVVKQKD